MADTTQRAGPGTERQVHPRAFARRRGDVQRVAGTGPQARAPRGAQGPQARAGEEPRLRALPPRDHHRRAPAAPPHPLGARLRRDGRAVLVHDAVRGGRERPPAAGARAPAAGGRGAPHRARGGAGAAVRPRARRGAPGHQAREPAADARTAPPSSPTSAWRASWATRPRARHSSPRSAPRSARRPTCRPSRPRATSTSTRAPTSTRWR